MDAPTKARIDRIDLTEKAIAALPTVASDTNKLPAIHRFDNGGGLAIRVTRSGSKHFIYCYTTGDADDLDSNGRRCGSPRAW